MCSFDEGIAESDLLCFAKNATSKIHKRDISITVEGPIVHGEVVSTTGLSVWTFDIDYNDYGHITGAYWLRSGNDDSTIPAFIADSVQSQIYACLKGKQDLKDKDEGNDND